MVRRALISVLAAGLMLTLSAGAAVAAPTNSTFTEKGLVETFVDLVPTCDNSGEPYTITTTSNLVEHETVFDDGRLHATFTQTGTFVAVPLEDPSLPTYTGKFTTWGGFNANGDAGAGTFTFIVRGTGSDGSTFQVSQVEHFNQRPDGSVNEFFHCQ